MSTAQGADRRTLSAVFLPSPGRDPASLVGAFARAGVRLTVARDLPDVLRLSSGQPFDACLIDRAAGRAAFSLARLVAEERPDLPVAMLIDRSRTDDSDGPLPAGVAELLAWPAETEDLHLFAANLRDRAAVDVEQPAGSGDEPIVESSPVMRLVMDRLRAAAAEWPDAVFYGEAGSGRRLLARMLHGLGDPDATRPLIEVDAARPAGELEERLFGGPGDSRPGADAEWVGAGSALAEASGGTLLVTHLARMPARQQARLARLLRDGEAIGGAPDRQPVALDVRLIVVAGTPLDDQVREGDLREDLAERLSALVVEVPPLRRRREDIPKLAAHFLRTAAGVRPAPAGAPDPAPRFSRAALALLAALPWPGNAAELRHLIEVVVPGSGRTVLQIDDLLERVSLDGLATRLEAGATLRDLRARFEREYISAVLARHHGRVGEAAKALGIQRTNLYRKVRQLNVARSLLGARR